MARNALELVMFAVTLCFLAAGTVSAQYGGGGGGGGGGGSVSYGFSNITLTQNNVTISPGSSASVNYTIALSSGLAYQSSAYILNQNQLSYNYGINFSISPKQGTPTYSGSITISAGKNAQIGKYSVLVGASGGDPSNNALKITINVLAPAITTASTTTTVAPKAANTTSTSLVYTTSISTTAATVAANATASGASSSNPLSSLWNAILSFFRSLFG